MQQEEVRIRLKAVREGDVSPFGRQIRFLDFPCQRCLGQKVFYMSGSCVCAVCSRHIRLRLDLN